MPRYYTDGFSKFFITSIPRFEEEEGEECEEEEEEECEEEFFELPQRVRDLIDSCESKTDSGLVNRLKKRYGRDTSLSVSDVLSLSKCQNCGGKRDMNNVIFGDVEKANKCEYCGNQYLNEVCIYFPEHGDFSCVSIEKDILSLKIREAMR